MTAPEPLRPLLDKITAREQALAVRKHLTALGAGTAVPVRADAPSPRRISSWIMRSRETLAESQNERLLQVLLTRTDIT